MKTLLITCGLLLYSSLPGQIVVNGYAKVTGIAGSVLTVTNVNETNDSFEDGEYIVIMQMQDDVIGTNTADAATFGNLSAIANAGRYEIRQIVSHTESGAFVPLTFTISGSLTYTYNTGANSSVQIISLRRLGSPHYTTASNITGLTWDGNVGGVVAIEVLGTLTLNHTISANGIGFRGGARSANYYDGTTNCISTPYRTNSTNQAAKGEGIYKKTSTTYDNARGKILNGGGGGNHINGGGAGGGNFSTGGTGGTGWNGTAAGCPAANTTGGLGGIALNTHISASRVFMGGGGGGGQQNDGVGTAGGNGGGIVLVKATTIQTVAGSCVTAPAITANGNAPAAMSGNDGSGGGGAAGSIVLQVGSYSIASGGCALTITANGGNGGTVNNSTHSGGGAGAQGTVIFSGTQPTTNVTTTTANGTAGCNNNSVPCNSFAGSATGTTNNGIITGSSGPLPVELLVFSAQLNAQKEVDLYWSTATEINNDYFTIERSADGYTWTSVLYRQGAGNSNTLKEYHDVDAYPLAGTSYYRLKQTDFDGTVKYSAVRVVSPENNETPDFAVYPNPFDGNAFNMDLKAYVGKTVHIFLHDLSGRQVYTHQLQVQENETTLLVTPMVHLPVGMYIVTVANDNIQARKKLVVE